MIKFDNVTATYKKNIGIFIKISFEVKPGELVLLWAQLVLVNQQF